MYRIYIKERIIKMSQKNKPIVNVKKTTTSTYQFDDQNLIMALLPLETRNAVIKGKATVAVFVNVPGGGDWSNSQLSINDDCKLTIVVEKTEE